MSNILLLMNELKLSSETILTTISKIDYICSKYDNVYDHSTSGSFATLGNGNGNGDNY